MKNVGMNKDVPKISESDQSHILKNTINAVVIGVGLPERSIGWLHLTQLLKMDSVCVRHIVEPWWLDKKQVKTDGGKEFVAACEALELSQRGIGFHTSVKELPSLDTNGPCLVLIASRTTDAPTLFKAAVEKGATHIYLEKPGAQNICELREMMELAERAGVAVILGYQKTVSDYVKQAYEASREWRSNVVNLRFEHHNPYPPEEIERVFRANPEGMLLNQCCHELALWSQKWKLKPKDLVDVIVHPQDTKLERFGELEDFSKLGFTATTTHGRNFTLVASRCGGTDSRITMQKGIVGEKKIFVQGSPELHRQAERMLAESPNKAWYYPLFESDYLKLKKEFVAHILAGQDGVPLDAPTLKDAASVLELAASLLPALLAQVDSPLEHVNRGIPCEISEPLIAIGGGAVTAPHCGSKNNSTLVHYRAKEGQIVVPMDKLSNSKEIVRWGILGCGKIANDFVLALQAVPNAVVAAVAARDGDRAQDFAVKHGVNISYGNYWQLVEDANVDLVYVATIPELHRQHAELALRAGKHVLVEKPLATTVEDAEAIQRLAKASGQFCMEGMWMRFFPAVELARQLGNEGRIGKICYVRADFGLDLVADEGKNNPKWITGAGMNAGVYPTHAAVMMLGSELVKLGAMGITDNLGYNMDAEGVLYASFSEGRTTTITWSHKGCTPEEVDIVGTEGAIRLHSPAHCPTKLTIVRQQGPRRSSQINSMSSTYEFPLPVVEGEFLYPNSEGLYYEVTAVQRCILAGLTECPQAPLSESVLVIKMIQQGVNEIVTGRSMRPLSI